MQLKVLHSIFHAHFYNINIHIYLSSARGHKLSWCVRAHAYRANSLSMQSFNNEEHLLDMLFTVKEIEIAIECIPYFSGYRSHCSKVTPLKLNTLLFNIFCSIAN